MHLKNVNDYNIQQKKIGLGKEKSFSTRRENKITFRRELES